MVPEKSRIQAPDRTQPVLPMALGALGGEPTTTLFAALDVANGVVIGKCSGRYRGTELFGFLKEIEAAAPEGLGVHLVMETYASHKTKKARTKFACRTGMSTSRRPRRHGSTRSSTGSQNRPGRSCRGACIERSRSSTPTLCPPSTRTTRSRGPAIESSPPTRSVHRSGGSASTRTNTASATRLDTNFGFGRVGHALQLQVSALQNGHRRGTLITCRPRAGGGSDCGAGHGRDC